MDHVTKRPVGIVLRRCNDPRTTLEWSRVIFDNVDQLIRLRSFRDTQRVVVLVRTSTNSVRHSKYKQLPRTLTLRREYIASCASQQTVRQQTCA